MKPPSGKRQLRDDLMSDMQSASDMLRAYEMALDSAEEKQLSVSAITKLEELMDFERNLLRRARDRMNKLRRGSHET